MKPYSDPRVVKEVGAFQNHWDIDSLLSQAIYTESSWNNAVMNPEWYIYLDPNRLPYCPGTHTLFPGYCFGGGKMTLAGPFQQCFHADETKFKIQQNFKEILIKGIALEKQKLNPEILY